MAGRQQFQNTDETEATVKRAVELYHRDRALQDTVVAAQSALTEMEIPAEYLDAAQKELDQEKLDKKARQQAAIDAATKASEAAKPKTISEAIAGIIHDWGFIYGPVIAMLVLFGAINVFGTSSSSDRSNTSSSDNSQAEVHDGTPQKWDFASRRSDFLLTANPETDADMVKMHEGDRTFERIHIRSFGRDPNVSNDAKSTAFYAQASLDSQSVYFHGLGQVKFKARGKGISKLFVGFTDKDGTVIDFSKDLALTSQWKEYTVDLHKLEYKNDNGDWQKDGQPPHQGGFYFLAGDGTNDLSESGTIDLADVELTN